MNRNVIVLGSGAHARVERVGEHIVRFPQSVDPDDLNGRLVLDCSTGHITEKDDTLLRRLATDDAQAVDGVRVTKMSYGWLVIFEETEPQDGEDRLSPAFWKLRRFAKDRGFDWVNLDRDGSTIFGLETFDW